MIRRNVDTHLGKELRADQDRPAEIVGRTFRHAAEEADWIAREIAALRQEGLRLGEIAVLARSLREIGPRLAYTLRTHEIPFHAPLAPQLHPSADALLSLLELAAAYPWEPAHDDARAPRPRLSALRRQPARAAALPPRTADALRRAARGGRFRAVLRGAGDRQAPANGGRGDLRALGAARPLPRARVSGRDARAGRGARRGDRALRRGERVRRRAGRVPGRVPRAASSRRTTGCRRAPPPADAVALLTVHQAKGLEWEAVFVCNLVEGRFPALARSQYALFDREAFGDAPVDEADARPPRARGGAAPLLRRADAGPHEADADRHGGAARGVRPLALTLLPGGAAVPRRESRARRAVSAAEALAALRRAGGGPAGWRDHVETTNANAMLPVGGLRTSASRLAPYENCALQFFFGSLVEIGRTRTTAMRLGGAFHDVLEAFHDPERKRAADARAAARARRGAVVRRT